MVNGPPSFGASHDTRVQVGFLEVVRLQLSTRNFLELQDVKPGKILIFLKNGKNIKIVEMVKGSLENFLDLGGRNRLHRWIHLAKSICPKKIRRI